MKERIERIKKESDMSTKYPSRDGRKLKRKVIYVYEKDDELDKMKETPKISERDYFNYNKKVEPAGSRSSSKVPPTESAKLIPVATANKKSHAMMRISS